MRSLGNIVDFARVAGQKRKARGLRRPHSARCASIPLALRGLLILGYFALHPAPAETLNELSFQLCAGDARDNCVIDGDTFYLHGEKVRIADIDAPETHPPRCAYEARLGHQATERLVELLNEGAFELETGGMREEDKYGRKLRTVTRQGRSLGDILVSEGLAREWIGHREPWCE